MSSQSTEGSSFSSVLECLTEQIVDPASYVKTVRGKKLKDQFRMLVFKMKDGDELWEWEWHGMSGVRNSYSSGWCLVRDGALVTSYCHSFG